MSIKGNIKSIILLIAVVIMFVAIAFLARENTRAFEKTIIAQTQEALLTIAESESQHILRRINEACDELRILAENPTVKNAIINGLADKQGPVVDGYSPEKLVYEHLKKDINSLYRLDNKGIVQSRFPWKKGKAGTDYSQKPGVKIVLKDHRSCISELFENDSGDMSFTICQPVFQDEQFVGIIRVLIKTEKINACMEDSKVGNRGYAQIIDDDGIMISHPKSEHINKDVIKTRKEAFPDHDWSDMEEIVSRMVNGEKGVGVYHSAWWFDEEPAIVKKLTAFVPVRIANELWSLGTVMNYDEISAPVNAHSRNANIGMTLLILLLFGAGAYYYRIQKEKTKLATEARSATKLRLVNTQLEKEIFERKAVEEELEEVNQHLIETTAMSNNMAAEAEMANIFKSQFLANMSHEIRTPMSAIIGFSNMLAEETITEEQREYVDIIRNSGESLLHLINDILDLSKIEAGKIDVEIIDCSLKEMLNSIEPLMKAKASEKGVEFQVVTTDALPAQIRTDPTRLEQCLINLANNAIKFTERGHVYVNVSLQENNSESFIRFDVEDTGIGIPAERQEQIFEPFVQADGSTTREFGGTGLGLTITKRLSELLGGTLSLTSEVGKGSVFSLVIPTGVDVGKQTLLDESGSTNQPGTVLDTEEIELSGSVLVAEDDPANQKLIRKLLEKRGFEVTIAEDGVIAVQKSSEQSFDLILMDMMMPRMNGYEATVALRDDGVSTPIIALTANSMKGDRGKCIEAGCDDYLSKPVNQDELRRILKKYVPAGSVSA